MTTFLELCNPFHQAISSVLSDEEWHSISELSKLHGVTPFFHFRTRSLGISLPEQLRKEWLGHFLQQIAEEKKARRQIKELKEVLDPEGIPFILLKGASAILRLYPEPGLRTFVDLDILIPSDRISQFKQTMMKTGYKPLSARNSPEDEELQKFDGHLDPLWKEEGIMIEPHLNILGAGGDHFINLPEIWQEKEETNSDGIKVCHLSREQFIVHTMFHFSRHLSDEGFGEIKWLIDLLYAIKTWRVDWSKVMDIAHQWGVEKDVLPIMATLNRALQTNIPLTEKGISFDLQTLMLGIKDQEKEYYAKLPKSYMKRLSKVRGLPRTTSQVRYLFHLLFPTHENLCWRYNLSGKILIMPYYLLHLFITFKKIFLGLWYKLLYHPQ
jgi:hypothetical protein